MKSDNYTRLLVTQDDGVLTGTLNLPPMNSVDDIMHSEIHRFFQEADADPTVRVIVLTGSGEKAFSAGGDISLMAADLNVPRRPMWLNGLQSEKAILQTVLNLSKPFIARINGHAMGLGANLAVLADISIMVADAKIADTHVKVGLAAGDGGALLWPLLIGFAKARRYLLTGDAITGREAAELGLVTEAVAREDLDARTAYWSDRLASGPGFAINGTKIAINLVLRGLSEQFIEAHYGLEVQSALSDDHREAVAAFTEKRAPTFTGR